MIPVVTKPDSAVVTVSQYSRDNLPLPSFGGKIGGKIKRGGSASILISSINCCNLSIDQGSFRSVPICIDRATVSWSPIIIDGVWFPSMPTDTGITKINLIQHSYACVNGNSMFG